MGDPKHDRFDQTQRETAETRYGFVLDKLLQVQRHQTVTQPIPSLGNRFPCMGLNFCGQYQPVNCRCLNIAVLRFERDKTLCFRQEARGNRQEERGKKSDDRKDVLSGFEKPYSNPPLKRLTPSQFGVNSIENRKFPSVEITLLSDQFVSLLLSHHKYLLRRLPNRISLRQYVLVAGDTS
ncbi:MAG: hypothetical protein VKK42_14620 [Lyngbya sp.]|nr:hypothetical protein [Lyngbya sp.]